MEGKSFARINLVLFVLGCGSFLFLNAAQAGLDSVHEGDLEVTGNLDVGGDFGLDGDGDIAGGLTVDGDTISVNTTWDSVGINVLPSSIGRLVIDGSIAVKKVDYHASEEEDYAMFYSKDSGGYVEMFALDEDGNYSQLTSHADPRFFDPSAPTSFGDPNIEVPFSFHHGNLYIGKGAVVDLAALVAEVERMTGRDLAVEYDLPPDEMRALEDRQARLVQRAKESVLEEDPEVEIAIEDAWEEVPVTELVQSTEQVTEYVYNLDALTVSPVTVERTVLSEVATGETTRQLKEDVRFDEATGKFFRKRTADDVQLESPPDVHLPQWIVDRLPPQ